MITITINRTNTKTPIYMQIYEKIKQDIIKGEIPARRALPSKRKLAEHIGVSIKTIENAYYQLMLEGYIYSKEKSGYYACDLSGYQMKRTVDKPYISKYIEHELIVDLKANKSKLENFPLSVWSRLVRESLNEDAGTVLDTVPFNGIAKLRIAIAKNLKEFQNLDVSPDQIVIGAGTEYLYGRLIQLLGRDKIFAMDDPGNKHIRTIYKSFGVEYHSIPCEPPEEYVDCLRKSKADILHVSPAQLFPLGYAMSIQRRIELLQWVNEAPDRYIIEDDYNAEYRYHGSYIQPIYGIDVRGKVIYMNTFSKTVTPSLRVSFMVLPEELMDRYIKTLSFYSCSVSSVTQHTLARFIEGGYQERYINQTKRFNIGQREMIRNVVNEYIEQYTFLPTSPLNGAELIEFSAGTHFLLKINSSYSDKELLKYFFSRKILISFVSEYCERNSEKYKGLIIINYSRVTKEQFCYFMEMLATLSPNLQPLQHD